MSNWRRFLFGDRPHPYIWALMAFAATCFLAAKLSSTGLHTAWDYIGLAVIVVVILAGIALALRDAMRRDKQLNQH
jgi:hypothetical protein